MSTPDWVGYEYTHRTGSGMLVDSSIPAYLRDERTHVVVPDDGPSDPIFEMTPTTKLARWMLRRANRAWGLPLAVLSAGVYAVLALFFYELHHVMVLWLAVLFGWNAGKFALVSLWLTLGALASALRALVRWVSRPWRVAPGTW